MFFPWLFFFYKNPGSKILALGVIVSDLGDYVKIPFSVSLFLCVEPEFYFESVLMYFF